MHSFRQVLLLTIIGLCMAGGEAFALFNPAGTLALAAQVKALLTPSPAVARAMTSQQLAAIAATNAAADSASTQTATPPPITLACYDTTPASEQSYDVSSDIHIHSGADAVALRQKIIDTLWPVTHTLPADRPAAVTKVALSDIPSTCVTDTSAWAPYVAGVERIQVDQEQGFHETMWHLIPKNPNGQIAFHDMGHPSASVPWHQDGMDLVSSYLSNGYDVVLTWLPLQCANYNDNPSIKNHKTQLAALTSPTFFPLSLFVSGRVIALNYLADTYHYSRAIVSGLSGGGWEATIWSAIDTRIGLSMPVSGSEPLFLGDPMCPQNPGTDYEQGYPNMPTNSFYTSVASYEDLYILASYPAPRKQVQFLNQYDTCCFAGTGYTLYKDIVASTTRAIGGTAFSVHLDTVLHDHAMSSTTQQIMLSTANSTTPPPPPPPSNTEHTAYGVCLNDKSYFNQSYALLPSSFGFLDGTHNYSIYLRLNPDRYGAPSENVFDLSGDANIGGGFFKSILGDVFDFRIAGADAVWQSICTLPVALHTSSALVITYDTAAGYSCYLNGQRIATNPFVGAILPRTKASAIGNTGAHAAATAYQGYLYEFRLYDWKLSDTDLSKVWSSAAQSTCVNL